MVDSLSGIGDYSVKVFRAGEYRPYSLDLIKESINIYIIICTYIKELKC